MELERVRGEDPAGVTTQVIHGLRRRTRRIPDEEALVHRVAEVVTLMMHERAEAPRPSITFLLARIWLTHVGGNADLTRR